MPGRRPPKIDKEYCGAILRLHEYCDKHEINFRQTMIDLIDKRIGTPPPPPMPRPLPPSPIPTAMEIVHRLIPRKLIRRYSFSPEGLARRQEANRRAWDRRRAKNDTPNPGASP